MARRQDELEPGIGFAPALVDADKSVLVGRRPPLDPANGLVHQGAETAFCIVQTGTGLAEIEPVSGSTFLRRVTHRRLHLVSQRRPTFQNCKCSQEMPGLPACRAAEQHHADGRTKVTMMKASNGIVSRNARALSCGWHGQACFNGVLAARRHASIFGDCRHGRGPSKPILNCGGTRLRIGGNGFQTVPAGSISWRARR